MSRVFTLEELAEYDGTNGKPAYIACHGKVFDVTDAENWVEGDHFGQHFAGRDLTEELFDAPHEEEVFEGVPVVGELAPG